MEGEEEHGVDVTLVRWMLSRRRERLAVLQEHVDAVAELRPRMEQER